MLLDIEPNALELSLIPNQMIVALFFPVKQILGVKVDRGFPAKEF